MDKIHDFTLRSESFGKASANENNSADTSNDRVSISPPTFQLKANSENPETEEKEETATQETTYQLAAEGSEPPADPNSPPSEDAPAQPNNTGLPNQLKSGVENLSGFSLNDVKVHYNSSKPAQLKAHAYAQGSDIHLAPGQEKHLPHEAWHVVQQKQGRVQATTQMKGVGVNDDSGLEKEADVMGAKAEALNINNKNSPSLKQLSISTSTTQRKPIKEEGSTDYKDDQYPELDLEYVSTTKVGNLKFTISPHGSKHTIFWNTRKRKYFYGEKGSRKSTRNLNEVFEDIPKSTFADFDLIEPKSFHLSDEAEIGETSPLENQKNIFEELDSTFEEAGVTKDNRGILNLYVFMTDDGIDVDISPAIRSGGAMNPFVEGVLDDSLKIKIKRMVTNVLRESGQWEYLETHKEELITSKWSVIIDVDFYYLRNKSATNFHMDTTGETLFTNLIYNDFKSDLKYGPEVITDFSFMDDETLDAMDEKVGGPDQFPKSISDDVIATRRRPSERDDGKTTVHNSRITPNQIVTFNDATSLHASPQTSMRNRVGLFDPFNKDIKEGWLAEQKKLTKAMGYINEDITEHRYTLSEINALLVKISTKVDEIDASKNIFLSKTYRKNCLALLSTHLGAMKSAVTNNGKVGILKEQVSFDVPLDDLDRNIEGDLTNPHMEDDILDMKAGTERRTFIRMWVQVMNTSPAELAAEITDFYNSIKDILLNREGKPISVVDLLLGSKSFKSKLLKFQNKISAALLVREKNEMKAVLKILRRIRNKFNSLIEASQVSVTAENQNSLDRLIEKRENIQNMIDSLK